MAIKTHLYTNRRLLLLDIHLYWELLAFALKKLFTFAKYLISKLISDIKRKRNDLERINSITSINDLKSNKQQLEDIYSSSISILDEEPLPFTNVLDNYEPVHNDYTKGIEISQCTFSGSHHFSIWEFSGYEPYHIFYDHYVGGDENGINIVLYNLNQSVHECFRECVYWLEYLRARILVKLKSEAILIENNSSASGSTIGSSSTASNSSSPVPSHLHSTPNSISNEVDSTRLG